MSKGLEGFVNSHLLILLNLDTNNKTCNPKSLICNPKIQKALKTKFASNLFDGKIWPKLCEDMYSLYVSLLV